MIDSLEDAYARLFGTVEGVALQDVFFHWAKSNCNIIAVEMSRDKCKMKKDSHEAEQGGHKAGGHGTGARETGQGKAEQEKIWNYLCPSPAVAVIYVPGTGTLRWIGWSDEFLNFRHWKDLTKEAILSWFPPHLLRRPDATLAAALAEPDRAGSNWILCQLQFNREDPVKRNIQNAKHRAVHLSRIPSVRSMEDAKIREKYKRPPQPLIPLRDWLADLLLLVMWRHPYQRSRQFHEISMLHEFGLFWPSWCGHLLPPAWLSPRPAACVHPVHIQAWKLRNPKAIHGEIWFVEVPFLDLHPSWITKDTWAPVLVHNEPEGNPWPAHNELGGGPSAAPRRGPSAVLIGFGELYVCAFPQILGVFARAATARLTARAYWRAPSPEATPAFKRRRDQMTYVDPESDEDLDREPPQVAAADREFRSDPASGASFDTALWEKHISEEPKMAELAPFLPPCMALKASSPVSLTDQSRFEFAVYAVTAGMPKRAIAAFYQSKGKKYPVDHIQPSRAPWGCNGGMKRRSGSVKSNCGCPFMENTGDRRAFGQLLTSSLADIEDIVPAKKEVVNGRAGRTGPLLPPTDRCSRLLHLRGAPSYWTTSSPVDWTRMALSLAERSKDAPGNPAIEPPI